MLYLWEGLDRTRLPASLWLQRAAPWWRCVTNVSAPRRWAPRELLRRNVGKSVRCGTHAGGAHVDRGPSRSLDLEPPVRTTCGVRAFEAEPLDRKHVELPCCCRVRSVAPGDVTDELFSNFSPPSITLTIDVTARAIHNRKAVAVPGLDVKDVQNA